MAGFGRGPLGRAVLVACLALGEFGGAGQARAEEVPETVAPEVRAERLTAYKAAFSQALKAGPEAADLAGLRAAFALSPIYKGTSELKELYAAGLLAGSADPLAGFDLETVERAIVRDFPLIDMHRMAFAYYKAKSPPDEARMTYHAMWSRALTRAVLDTGRTEGTVTTYAVLSVGEEYELLGALDLEPAGQTLEQADGVAHDVFRLKDRTIRFDISAFFGKF